VRMTEATHATVALFRMDLAKEEAQRQGLRDVIVPGVREAPGFVTGYWTLDRAAGESVAFIAFESLETAEALAENVRNNASNQAAVGIELLSVRIAEITAHA
jgi:hypothetical protein